MLELNQSNSEEILIKDVNEDTFMDDVIEASKSSPIVVDFWAPWCGPCKTLIPRLEQIEKEYPDVKFIKIDVDENMDTSLDMGIRSVPTVVIVKDGVEINRFTGMSSKMAYVNAINEGLQ